MRHCEEGTQEDTETANNDIGDPKEGIPSTHDGSGGNDHGLGTFVDIGWEVVHDINLVYACLHRVCVVALVQLAEGW